jgi:hypothetical protein
MRAVCVGLIIGCALISELLITDVASATSEWQVARSEPALFNTSPFCPTYRQIVGVQGYAGKQELCLFGGQSLQVGTFFADGSAPRVAVMFPFDDVFRVVEGLCQGSAGCLYSPQKDVIVSKYPGGVIVFDRLTSRLHFSLETQSYIFDPSEPLYVFQESVGAIGLSRNGEWLVIEIKSKGIDLVNVYTHEKKRIVSPGTLYGFGRDPAEELAVSNEGNFVAVMGERAGFQLIEVTPLCEGMCEVVMGDVSAFIQNFNFASHPVFDEPGKQLSFYAASFRHGMRRVVVRQKGYVSQQVAYLALGDSFTSGEGETEDIRYRIGTNDPQERCHVSTRSYPFLLGGYLGLMLPVVQNVACAGAKIVDIVGSSSGYEGQGGRLGTSGRQLSMLEQGVIQTEALDTFQPGRIPQMDFLERYQPALVTVGVSGNDAGFMGKLKTCAMPDLCEWASDPKYRFATGQERHAMFVRLQQLYVHISKTTEGLVYAVGYPQIIDPNGVCDPVTTTLLTYAERVFMKEGITYLNQVIKAAIESVGGVYLDIEQSLEGRMLCSPGLSLGVNGLRIGDDIALHTSFSMLKVIGNESFHPTPLGHEMIAAHIIQNYGDLRLNHACSYCQQAVEPPLPSPYWGARGADSPRMQSVDMLEQDHLTSASSVLRIRLPAGSLKPLSKIVAEVHSAPQLVGELSTGIDGGLSIDIPVPTTISEGYHTLHLHALTNTLEEVDLYQTISYEVVSDVYLEQSHNLVTQELGGVSTLSQPLGSVLGIRSSGLSGAPVDNNVAHNSLTSTSEHPITTQYLLIGMLVLSGAGVALIVVRSRRKSTQDPGG